MKKQNIFITGASGLVARYLINELINNTNYNIVAISSCPKVVEERHGRGDRVKCINYETFLCDQHINLNNDYNNNMIHCAFTRKNNAYEVKHSIDLSRRIFNKCTNNNFNTVINISSRSVYKEPEEGTLNTEDSEIYLPGLIAIGKYTTELILKAICEESNLAYTNLRLASVSELKNDNNMIRPLNVFVENMILGKDIQIIGGMQVMSYIDPTDVASAIRTILQLDPSQWKTIYNIGTGWMCTDSILNMAHLVVKQGEKFGFKPVKININKKIVNQHAGLDITRITTDTKWLPRMSLDKMIDEIYKMKLNQN